MCFTSERMTNRLPEIISRYIDAYNARDVEGMLATLTEDVCFENVSNSDGSMKVEGKAELAELARASAAALSARRQSVRSAVVTPERVAVDLDFEATVAADLPNGWKAGQTIALRGVSFFEIRDGLIAGIVDFS